MPFALYRKPFYLALDDGEHLPDVRKSAACLMSEPEAEALAAKINQHTTDPYEVVGVRNEV